MCLMINILIAHTHTSCFLSSGSGHSFSSLSSSTGSTGGSVFSQSRLVNHSQGLEGGASAAAVVVPPEGDLSSQSNSSLDASQSGDESINRRSSFGGEESNATTATIGQQKATAILPEVHLVTGKWTSLVYGRYQGFPRHVHPHSCCTKVLLISATIML